MVTEKKCTLAITTWRKKCLGPCEQVKPLEAFDHLETGKLGRASRCKECHKLQIALGRPSATPRDRFFNALEKYMKTTGRQYARMSDAFHVMTVVLGYTQPKDFLQELE